MDLPGKGTLQRKVMETYFFHPNMTIEQYCHQVQYVGHSLDQTFLTLVRKGFLDYENDENTYALSVEAICRLHNFLTVKKKYVGEIAPSRTLPAFKPLSAKYIPSAYGTRDERSEQDKAHYSVNEGNEVRKLWRHL